MEAEEKHKVEPYDTKRTLTEKRLPEVRWRKGGSNPRTQKIKTAKNKPAPGDYNHQAAYLTTQKTKVKSYQKSRSKRVNYFDKIIRSKSKVPGVGAYKNYEKSFDIISKSPCLGRSRCR